MEIRPSSERADGAVRLHPVGTKARGWGYEPDTRAAITWLEQRVKPGMTVCDVGTGTGILALVAAKLGVTVTDYDSAAAVMVTTSERVEPDAERAASYERLYAEWLTVADALRPLDR